MPNQAFQRSARFVRLWFLYIFVFYLLQGWPFSLAAPELLAYDKGHMRNFILIGLLIVLLFSRCGNQKTFSSSELVGIWKFTHQFGDSSPTVLMSGIISFEASGKSTVEAAYTLNVGDKKATYNYKDISNWRIEGIYLIENTIESEFYNYSGDIDLIDFIKNLDDTESGEDEKSKILEQSKTKMIILMDLDEEILKATFQRIQ